MDIVIIFVNNLSSRDNEFANQETAGETIHSNQERTVFVFL